MAKRLYVELTRLRAETHTLTLEVPDDFDAATIDGRELARRVDDDGWDWEPTVDDKPQDLSVQVLEDTPPDDEDVDVSLLPFTVDDEQIIQEVCDYAERLVAAGDTVAFEEAFHSKDLNLNVRALALDDPEEIAWIHDNYVKVAYGD